MDLEANVDGTEITYSDEDMARDLGVTTDESEEHSEEEQVATEESNTDGTEKPLYKVHGNTGGEQWEKEVDLDELLNGYMRQEDATRKNQATAAARREIEAAAQKQTLDDFYGFNTRQQPKVVQSDLQDIKDGKLELSADDLALMEPEVRKVYEYAAAVKKETLATASALAELKAEALQRKQIEHNQYLESTMQGFYDKLIAGGMDPIEADIKAAEVSRTVRTEKLPYNPTSFDRVYKSTQTVDIEAIKRQAKLDAIAEYQAAKAKDATAGLAGAGAVDTAMPDFSIADLMKLDDDEQDRMIAAEILGGD